MSDVTNLLRAATEQAPPTGIDVDRLIDQENRARHRRRVAYAGLAGSVVLATTGTVVVLSQASPTGDRAGFGGPTGATSTCAAVRPTPSSSDQPSYEDVPRGSAPVPEETEPAAVARLSSALRVAFGDHLPGRTVADVIHVGCHWVQFEPNIYPARYYAWADVTDAAGTGGIVIMISDKPYPGLDMYDHHETLPDGTQVGWLGDADRPDATGVQLGVLRPDGTHITVLCFNTKGLGHELGRSTAPATVDELVAIASDPGLTLYP